MRKASLAMATLIAAASFVLPSFGTAGAGQGEQMQIGRVHDTFQPQDGKIYVLLLGHDARPGESRARADAIHIAGIDTKTMKGGILNFPRDSFVSIPGIGRRRINEAFYYGGPQLTAKTLESMTGIRIDYWVSMGFRGFQSAVGAIGGVEIKLPRAIYDVGASGARLDAGRQVLTGWQALAYARARKVFQGGDVQRTTNQGRFLLAALKKLGRETSRNPAKIFKWMSAVDRYGSTDLTPDEMFRLGVIASQVRKQDVGNVTIPTSGGFVGPASVLFVSPGAQSIYSRFRKNGFL